MSRDPSWLTVQKEIGDCRACAARWAHDVVDALKPGEIPNPPTHVRMLFIGVAPTPKAGKNKGTHFYTAQRDALRRDLFVVLDEVFGLALSQRNQSDWTAAIKEFLYAGFFFIHATKIRPRVRSAPPKDCIQTCAAAHLPAEVSLIAPNAICFLGVTNLRGPISRWLGTKLTENPATVTIGEWKGPIALSAQPVRGGKGRCEQVMRNLCAFER